MNAVSIIDWPRTQPARWAVWPGWLARSALNIGPGDTVLDLAAGTAVSTVELAKSGAWCVAADFSVGMLGANGVVAAGLLGLLGRGAQVRQRNDARMALHAIGGKVADVGTELGGVQRLDDCGLIDNGAARRIYEKRRRFHQGEFGRADLGQIEPRVLAAVSQDPLLARATQGDDLYAPVAERLGVDRATAKVAVRAWRARFMRCCSSTITKR